MRATSRIADVSINTVTKLLEEIAALVQVEAPKKRGPYKKKNSN